jgi:hypothetical protein
MTDLQELLLVFLAVYVLECIVWVDADTVLFSRSIWGRRKVSLGKGIFGNDSGNLRLLNPLSFSGDNHFACWFPVSVSPEGICAFAVRPGGGDSAALRPGRSFRFEEIMTHRIDGRWLRINDEPFCKFPSADQAESLSRLIGDLSGKSVRAREKKIRGVLAGQLDEDRLSSEMLIWRKRMLPLRLACTGYFMFAYLALPGLALYLGLELLVVPALIGFLLFGAVTGGIYCVADRKIRGARREGRVPALLKMIAYPPAAIRSVDLLSLPALQGFSPLLLSAGLPAAEGLEYAQTVIRNLRHPAKGDWPPVPALSIVNWFAGALRDASETFVSVHYGLAREAILSPPPRDGDSSVYCPRCESQYLDLTPTCIDCPGVETIRYDPIPPNEVPHGE